MSFEPQKAAVNTAKDTLNNKLITCESNGDHGNLTVHSSGRRYLLSFSTHNNQSDVNAALSDNGDLTLRLGELLGVGGHFTLTTQLLGSGSLAAVVTFTN